MERTLEHTTARCGPLVRTELRRALVLTAASLGFVVVQLDVTIVNVALQQISRSLGADVSYLQWVVDAYTIVFASLILTAGALGDRLGARRIFIAGFAAFIAGSCGCAVAPTLAVLIAARAAQGIGAAALVPCSLALLNHSFYEPNMRAKAVAIWAAGASVALAAGPVIGGMLVDGVSWRAIFVINLPIGATGIWLARRFAAESPRSRARGIDAGGQVAIVVALASLATAAIEAGRLGIAHPVVMVAFGLFIAAATAFVLIEAQGSSPMLPLSVFRNAAFAAAMAVGLLINIAYYGLIFLFSLFLQRAKGFSSLQTGLAFLPMTCGVLVTNLSAGYVEARLGPPLPMALGQAMMLLGCVALLNLTSGTAIAMMAVPMMLMGAGVGLVVPPMTSSVLGTVDRAQSGIASGALNATRQTGSVLGVALYGALIASPGALTSGTRAALGISAGLLVVGCAAALRTIRGGRQ
jgi:DHA2 family methylenomycin A resistance protein-like MFS transporter